MSSLEKYPFLQMLAYNAILGNLAKGFLGLQDFYDEMTVYSNSNQILKAAWALIQTKVPLNTDLQAQMYVDPVLGQVGLPMQSLVGFSQTFAVDPEDLQSATASSVVSSNS